MRLLFATLPGFTGQYKGQRYPAREISFSASLGASMIPDSSGSSSAPSDRLFRRLVVTSLCATALAGSALAGPFRHKSKPPQVQGPDRVLHALDRLTFGPRPGETAAVEKMGLSRWFELQLRPETISDSTLQTRLQRFPALTLTQADLIRRYPSPQMLREIVARSLPLPTDPVEHAIYADQIAFYEAAKARKEAIAAAGGPDAFRNGMRGEEKEQARVAGPTRLPGDDAVGYSIRLGGKNNAAKTGEEQGTGMAAQGDDAAAVVPGKGRQRHAEAIFPETSTSAILTLEPPARLQKILAMTPPNLIAFRRSLSTDELHSLTVDMSAQQKEILASLEGSARMIDAELLQSRLERDIYSNRQVEAVMTDFWLNHFNIFLQKNGNEPYLLPAYERETIRVHALGRFEDLLVATARSPAMLLYLDNWESTGPDSPAAIRGARGGFAKNPQAKNLARNKGLNENYARELMELHTVGVSCEVSMDHPAKLLNTACGTGYTQADVTEVAKVFSGWTIDRPEDGGAYRFDERRHEPGAKRVMGQTVPEAGEKEGLEVLHLLASSPATAHFLATKLAVRFVSDTPPATLVDTMTQAYLRSDGDMRIVLRAMFAAPEFWSPAAVHAKVKTPLEFLVSALRASDAQITDAVPLVQALGRLGMPLYGMQTPNGYDWSAEPWVSTGALVNRMNLALALSGDHVAGTRIDWVSLLTAGEGVSGSKTTHEISPGDADVAERRLELLLLGMPASERTRAAVEAQTPSGGGVPRRGVAAAATAAGPDKIAMAGKAGLLLGSPEFQRR